LAAPIHRRLGGRLLRAQRRLTDPRSLMRLSARMPHPYWEFRFHRFGPDSHVKRPIWLAGAHKIAIGNRCVIFPGFLSVEPQAWDKPGPALVIGDGAAMRHFCTISAAESVVIEEDVSMAPYVQIFDGRPGMDGPHDQPELNPLVTEPVRIGRGAGLGERVAVLPGSNIGRHAMVGANSVVDGDIPDYALAVGVPARVVGRTRAPEAPGS
jgi:acetyltransferase-like isoleucine patch superfamily enzyme